MVCTLCGSASKIFSGIAERTYFKCLTCNSVALDTKNFLSPAAEKERYALHNNDINDPGYQKFVSPITNAILSNYTTNHKGLDFGSGSGPVITSLLRKEKYNVSTYDPFFDANTNVLKKKYDYIICCEVMEHFYNPAKEFKLLCTLLNPGGTLYCKTTLFDESIDFDTWWYKNDPTHVFFYTKQTLYWIKEKLGFKSIEVTHDLISFSK